MSNKPLSGPTITFADVTLVDTARVDQRFDWLHPHERANVNGTLDCKWCHVAPVLWLDGAGGLGGMWFSNVSIIDDQNRPWLRYYHSACTKPQQGTAKCPRDTGDIRGSVTVKWSGSANQCNASLIDKDNGTKLESVYGHELLRNVSIGCVDSWVGLKNNHSVVASKSDDTASSGLKYFGWYRMHFTAADLEVTGRPCTALGWRRSARASHR